MEGAIGTVAVLVDVDYALVAFCGDFEQVFEA